LLAAGFPPGAAVEAFRPGHDTWDVRATSIRAAAEAHLTLEGQGLGPPPGTPPRPRRERRHPSHRRSREAA
jgi:hypothetical protein